MVAPRARYTNPGLERQRLLAFVRRDRRELMAQLREAYPCLRGGLHPPASVVDEILDMLGFRLAIRELPLELMAVCDFDLRIVALANRLEDRVRPRTDMAGLKAFTKAHELGHIRLGHLDEVRKELADGTLPLFDDDRPRGVVMMSYREDLRRSRPWHERVREREADLYATEFLVPYELLEQRPEYRTIAAACARGGSVDSDRLWKQVYDLAAWFQVSPRMMKNRLTERGLLVCQGKSLFLHPQGLLPLPTEGWGLAPGPEGATQLTLDLESASSG